MEIILNITVSYLLQTNFLTCL